MGTSFLQGGFTGEATSFLRDVVTFAEGQRPQLRALLARESPRGIHAGRYAAAAMVRVPYLVKAVLRLCEDGQPFEADLPARVLAELAITAMWIGTDEARAESAWDHGLEQDKTSYQRIKELGVNLGSEFDSLVKGPSKGRDSPFPSLATRAREATDPAWSDVERDPSADETPPMALTLYNTFYGLLCSSSHESFGPAYLTLNDAAPSMVPIVQYVAAYACFILLIAVRDPLSLSPAPLEALLTRMSETVSWGRA
jgi:hypothetical protein